MKTIRRKKHPHLLAKKRARGRIVQEACDVSYPVRPVKVVDHGEDFHAVVFRFQKRHHPVVNGTHVIVLHHVKNFIGLVVHRLQTAVGGKHVQPVGIKQIDLAGKIAQRREAGGVPGNVERRADAFFLV